MSTVSVPGSCAHDTPLARARDQRAGGDVVLDCHRQEQLPGRVADHRLETPQ
jgi:hypothetical protein